MKYSEKFYDKKDLIKAYAAKRKNLSEREVEDLLNSLIKFIQKDVKTENNYAYHLRRIGTIYKKFQEELDEKSAQTDNERLDKMMFDVMFQKYRHPLLTELRVDKEKEELQCWQNSAQ